MTTSFNWTITCLERYISTGLVKKVHWRLNAEQSGYKQYSLGIVTLPPPGENFIPFEDLTEEIIIGWLGSIQEFDKTEAETGVNNPENAYYTMNYELATPFLHKALADALTKIDELQARIVALESN